MIGTSTKLEKDYFRAHSEMINDAKNVRPLHVLVKAFDFVMNKYKENKDYKYILNQLKSIRQDMLLQNIKNDFCVKVYEASTEISIQNEDIENANITLSMLIKDLYNTIHSENDYQFYRYYLIYNILYDIKEMNYIIQEEKFISYKKRIRDIIDIMKAMNEKNYIKLFILFSKLNSEIERKMLIPFVVYYKIQAMILLSYGFYTVIDINYLYEKIGRDSTKEEFINYMKELGVIMIDTKVKCRESISILKSSKYLYKKYK